MFSMVQSTCTQQQSVQVVQVENDHFLYVHGEKFMVNGMNWDYVPIGTNSINDQLWDKSDEIIKTGLDAEMILLKNMHVNAIRHYTGIPAKWIQYIYEEHGIYTMLNHSFGRYGLTIDGQWIGTTNYADSTTQKILVDEVLALVNEYKDTPGLLLYLLGNENNYGLFWDGAETENIPNEEEKKKFVGENRARPMYALMNEAAKRMKSIDPNHPVAICNGDILFLDIIADECSDVDIYGTNTYRGISFGDMFDELKKKYNKPVLFTEFGADAFNAISMEEDQIAQAYYMTGNWQEIYKNAGGLGLAGNCIGGFTFQFSDGWWKFGFDQRAFADIHDNNASWSNGGYLKDYIEGENNMNEEWFGICAKGPTDERGLYALHPRAAYYALQQVHSMNPYKNENSVEKIDRFFESIDLEEMMLKAAKD